MKFKSEADLQAFIHSVTGGEREVVLSPGNRIDILTNDQAIEVKPTLTASALDKAAGQIYRYSPYIGSRQRVIAGLAPEKGVQSVWSVTQSLQDAGIQVWFVDEMPVFVEHYNQHRSPQHISVPQYEYPDSSDDLGCLPVAGVAAGVLFAMSLMFGGAEEPIPSAMVQCDIPYYHQVGGDVLGCLADDQEIGVVRRGQQWSRVCVNEKCGWIESRFLD